MSTSKRRLKITIYMQPGSKVSDLALAIHGHTRFVLMPGKIYALVEEDERLAAALVWGTVVQTCENFGAATVISARPAETLERSGLRARAADVQEKGRLGVFRTDNQSGEGFDTLLADLQYCVDGESAILFIDNAEQWLDRVTEASMRCLQDWASHNQCAVLLLFRALSASQLDSAAQLLPVSHAFAGMARISHRYGATAWEVFHWFTPTGFIAKESWALALNETAGLEMLRSEAEHVATSEPAVDEMQVYAQRAVFQIKEPPPAGWRVADDHELAEQVGNGEALTVVLAFTVGTEFFELARKIYDLRTQRGPRLKIVIREVNSRLRYGQESLALRLGANLVVPAEVSFVRFLSLTAMVQGQVFPHRLPASFEQALRDSTPDEERGYLSPYDFVRGVTNALERSRILHLQSALVCLPLAFGLLPLDALRYCDIRRSGDLVTADDRCVYLYLFACRELDIDKTLEKLFSLPVGELFRSEGRFLSPDTIRDALEDLNARHAQQLFPDLTAELTAAVATRAAAPAPDAEPADKQGLRVVRYKAPPPAVRRPLLVKGAPVLIETPIKSP